MTSLASYLEKEFNLDTLEISDFLQMGKPFTTEKGHYLLKPRQTSNRVFFVETGIVREFEQLPTKEKTSWIIDEGNWLYNKPSYYTQNPTKSFLQALTHAEGYYFLQQDLEQLVEESHLWALVQTKIYRNYIMQLLYQDELHSLETVAMKLDFFEKMQPTLQNRIKQEHIASFLNASMSQLSRVRRNRRT